MTTPEHNTKTGDCPKCGIARADWPDSGAGGYAKEGIDYCCQGCIEGPGCTCTRVAIPAGKQAPTSEEIQSDPASGRFVQSLQHQTDHISPNDYGTDVTTVKGPGTSEPND